MWQDGPSRHVRDRYNGRKGRRRQKKAEGRGTQTQSRSIKKKKSFNEPVRAAGGGGPVSRKRYRRKKNIEEKKARKSEKNKKLLVWFLARHRNMRGERRCSHLSVDGKVRIRKPRKVKRITEVM